MRQWLLFLLMLLYLLPAQAQDTYFPLQSPAYDYLRRMEILSGDLHNEVFLDGLPVGIRQSADFLISDTSLVFDSTTRASRFTRNWLLLRSRPYAGTDAASEKPLLKYLYRSPVNFFEVNQPDFNLYVNPVIGLEAGYENVNGFRFRNSRGGEIRGVIDNKIGFYTYFTENQLAAPQHVAEFTRVHRAVPREGLTKFYKGDSSKYDYFNARGYITASISKHINFQIGHDRNFIGYGHRSLLLSDFAGEYPFLRINTQVWRLRYQNIYARFTDYYPFGFNRFAPKYGAFHYLSFDAARWLNLGLFEGVIFADIRNRGRGFDFSYFNPVIFYRYLEQQLGSDDNAVAGGNITILPFRGFALYGQFLLDEFQISELRSGAGYWGNKFGLQGGFRYVNVAGIDGLDWQAEANLVRPYTYSSDTSAKNYQHYRQNLAHPLGSNFREIINIIDIRTLAPLEIKISHFFIQQGRDTVAIQGQRTFTSNWGANPHLPYSTREREYDNRMLQGILTNIQLLQLQVSYLFRQNIYLDLRGWYRQEKALGQVWRSYYAGVGLRLNFHYPSYDF